MKKALLMSLIAGAAAVSATAATATVVDKVSSPITEGTTFVGSQVFEGQLEINKVLLQIGMEDGSQTGTLTIQNTTNPLANKGRIQVNKGSTLYVYTGKNPGWTTASQGQRIDIYGTVETAYGTDSAQLPTDTNGYNLEVIGSNELRVFDGGVFNFKNGAMRLSSNGIINLKEGSKTTVGRIVFGGTGAKLIIGANDVLSTASGGKPSIVLGSSANGTVDVSATTDLKLGNIQIQGRSSLTINLSATHGLLTVAKLDVNEVNTYPFDGTESLILNDFVNDTFKIEDASNVEIVGDSLNITKIGTTSFVRSVKLVAKDADGKTLCGEGEHWEIQNGFLNIVSNIPEPAEWAAIFGGIALALALYRRRR